MLKVAVIQSNYIPWKGYFDLIGDVDTLVFYDDVQYTKNDWRNRNKIKTANGVTWLSVPCGKRLDRRICDVKITDNRWQRKHWLSIKQAYSKAARFQEAESFLEDFYCSREWDSLSAMNQHFIKSVAVEFLGLKTRFLNSSDFELSGSKQDRLLDLLHKVGASSYLSGPSAKSYISPGAFDDAGIELLWKSYDGYPEYEQPHPPYQHNVSVVDLLCCTGNDAKRFFKAESPDLAVGT